MKYNKQLLNTSGKRFPESQIGDKIKMVQSLLSHYKKNSQTLNFEQINALMEKGASVLTCIIAGASPLALSRMGYKYEHAEFEMLEPDFETRLDMGMKYARENNIELPFDTRTKYKMHVEKNLPKLK